MSNLPDDVVNAAEFTEAGCKVVYDTSRGPHVLRNVTPVSFTVVWGEYGADGVLTIYNGRIVEHNLTRHDGFVRVTTGEPASMLIQFYNGKLEIPAWSNYVEFYS